MQTIHLRYYGALAADSSGTTDDRPPLVLLHGLGFDRRQWAPVLQELAVLDPDRRTLAFDLPGHRDSPKQPSYDLGDVADLLHEAVVEAGLQKPLLVGHSISGALATIYAARYPTAGVVNVDQPLLVGPFKDVLNQLEPTLRSPAYGEVWDRMLDGMLIEQLPQEAQDLVNASTRPTQEMLLGYWREVMESPAEKLKADREADLRSIDVPYTYVTGTEPPPPYRQWLETNRPGITIIVLPGSGHFPHLAHPGELAKLLAG
ncbi:alpha/beta hydrolase [Kribbella sp. NPDC051770]|uniref:alpha/beta fold hydrolase n=1 Tax=Kribbella sp. NPDC051770 TaxID=3155413 RepID=UPI00344664EA